MSPDGADQDGGSSNSFLHDLKRELSENLALQVCWLLLSFHLVPHYTQEGDRVNLRLCQLFVDAHNMAVSIIMYSLRWIALKLEVGVNHHLCTVGAPVLYMVGRTGVLHLSLLLGCRPAVLSLRRRIGGMDSTELSATSVEAKWRARHLATVL